MDSVKTKDYIAYNAEHNYFYCNYCIHRQESAFYLLLNIVRRLDNLQVIRKVHALIRAA